MKTPGADQRLMNCVWCYTEKPRCRARRSKNRPCLHVLSPQLGDGAVRLYSGIERRPGRGGCLRNGLPRFARRGRDRGALTSLRRCMEGSTSGSSKRCRPLCRSSTTRSRCCRLPARSSGRRRGISRSSTRKSSTSMSGTSRSGISRSGTSRSNASTRLSGIRRGSTSVTRVVCCLYVSTHANNPMTRVGCHLIAGLFTPKQRRSTFNWPEN